MYNNHDHINHVCECNRMFNSETLNPLVSLIDMSSPLKDGCMTADCYAVWLKDGCTGCAGHGRSRCDYSDGMMLFAAPPAEISPDEDGGKMLLFHPVLTRCTPLGLRLKEYTFFRYTGNEALHLSCREKAEAERLLGCIGDELQHGVDEYSSTIICNLIELLLNYCRRFYTRQFITRHRASARAVAAAAEIIDGWMMSGRAAEHGLPTSGRLASRLGMSAAYLDDMLKNETGKTVSQYVQLRRMLAAKQMLLGTDMTADKIADMLGFCTGRCFSTVFSKATGLTPEEYRAK